MTAEARLTSSNERSGGKLRTQVGPAAWVPIWIAGTGLTDGEFRVYVALRSYADQDGEGCFPSTQAVADRAFVAYTTARNALQKFAKIGLVVTERREREDRSQTSNDYLLIDVCPPHLAAVVEENRAKHQVEKLARKEAVKASKKKKAQAKADAKAADDPHPEQGRGGYPTQGRPANPRKVGAGNPGGVAVTTPGFTTPGNTPSLSGAETAPASTATQQTRERPIAKPNNPTPSVSALVDDLVAEAQAKHPRWGARLTRKAIQAELDDGRQPDEVAAAWRRFIVHPRTTSPGFFAHPLEWWDDPASARPAVPPQRKPACELCDHGWVIDQETLLPLEPAVKCTHKAMAGVS